MGGDAVLCRPVVGELWFGVFNSGRSEAAETELREALAIIEILEFDQAAAIEYGRIMAELRSIGRLIPQIDVQIAAIARVHNIPVATADHHFS